LGRSDTDERIKAIRHFNRFYTPLLGLLNESYLESPYSLTQVRVLYELAHQKQATATELCRALRLDAGYLSRILGGFRKRGLVDLHQSKVDGRQKILSLSKRGRQAFAPLDRRSHDEIGSLLGPVSPSHQTRVVEAMRVIEGLLGDSASDTTAPYVLRPPGPGDMGWVVMRHGALYAEEFGWDEHFEALVAGIVAKFIEQYNPKRERCWIAERDGEPIGCVFIVKESDTVARLRLMLVEPTARGLGVGTRLVEECLRFSRIAGYKKVVLWTNNVLSAARHIYEKAGFRLIKEEPHRSFGHDLIGETWMLDL